REIWAPQAWRTAIPEELYTTTFVATETMRYLEAFAKEDGGEPFFIQCSFPDPHHPFTPPGRYFDMYDQESIPTPSAFHHPADRLPPHVAHLHGEREDGTVFKDGMMSFACTE